MKRDALIKLREDAGITQEEVALRANMKRSSYGNIEAGIRNPTLPVAQKIATAYNVPLEEALPGEIFFGEKCYDMKLFAKE